MAGADTVGADRMSGAVTQMYRGANNVGRIEASIGQIRAEEWHVDCDASDSGAFLTRGRSLRERTRINVHHWDGYLDGYSRLQGDGRWVIYHAPNLGFANPLAGVAVRRSPWHWDVLRGRRTVGRTVGPDGPEAATAFLIAGC